MKQSPMVNPEHFEKPTEQIISELRKDNEWYTKKYGPIIKERGLGNWKNLFRRPNMYEWVILAMLVLALFMGWAYVRDFEVYKENIQQHSCEICQAQREAQGQNYLNYTFKEENSTIEEMT